VAPDEDEEELDFDADLLDELDGVGTDVPVGTAPTPLVIGPLSVVSENRPKYGVSTRKACETDFRCPVG